MIAVNSPLVRCKGWLGWPLLLLSRGLCRGRRLGRRGLREGGNRYKGGKNGKRQTLHKLQTLRESKEMNRGGQCPGEYR